MDSRISRRFLRILTSLALVSAVAIAVAAQNPDPNSPTPILLSEAQSTRALAEEAGKIRGNTDLLRSTGRAFLPEEKIEIFVTNLDLMEDEGANAFRVIALDRKGRQYRFPVLGIEPVIGTDGVYRVTIVLKDEIGYWEGPVADGDVLIYITWRGLASNRVRLGLGELGGDLKEDPAARPTPLGTKGSLSRPDAPNAVGDRWTGDRSRFMEQATFGPNLTLENRLRRIGIRSWINEQFAAQYPSAGNPYPSNVLQPANQPTNCNGNTADGELYPTCQRDSYSQYQPQTWFFKEAFYGNAQLKHRVAWALGQIWVTSGNDIQQGRHMVEWHKVLSKHSFGNYRDLMKEMTLHPTMGEYLNMRESTRLAPNENYAREIKQLFTVGLFMLNPDGTLQRDAQNNPIPTYSQDEVNAFTRVLTGWSFCNIAASCPNLTAATVNFIDPMILNVGVSNPFLTNNSGNRHDINSKTLLDYPGVNPANRDIPACGAGCLQPTAQATALLNIRSYADSSMDKALDNLFNHPNVGPFVGKILIQHLVTSDPSPAYVGRVAAKFNNNGVGVRGDMKAVIKAILLDPEARGDVKTDPNFGKLREPVLLMTNFARTFGVRSANGTGLSDGSVAGDRTCGRGQFNAMAQIPFRSPTVFNFYPPDYGIPGTSLIGPEFAIMTTGTAVARASFINQMTFAPTNANTPAPVTTPTAAYAAPIPVSGVDCPNGTSFNFTDLVALSQADTTGGQMVDELNRRMLGGTMSSTMRSTILATLPSYAGTTALTHESRVRQAVYLVATSSQYQVQR